MLTANLPALLAVRWADVLATTSLRAEFRMQRDE
jgi:hypothetical protein